MTVIFLLCSEPSILEVALNIYDIEINTAVCYTESKMSAEDGKSRAGCDLARRIKDMRNDEKNTYSDDGKVFCQQCGAKIDENDVHCPNCGAFQGERYVEMPDDPADAPIYKKKGGSIPLIIGIILISLLIVGGGGYLLYSQVFAPSKEASKDLEELDEKEEKTVDADEVDLDKVDINATENSYCTLAGNVKKASNGSEILSWGDGLTVYALDSDGDKVLVEDVSSVYVDDAKLQTGLLAALAANEKVKIGGDLSVHGDKLYLEANKVMNEDGVELVLEKGKTETITEEKEAVEETAGDAGGYVLPQSSSRLLTDADVAGLSLQQINYAKNEIYARHGRLFDSRELQNYFNSQSWYSGTIAPANFSESLLSDVEKKNVAFLKNLEFSISPNGYQLDQ